MYYLIEISQCSCKLDKKKIIGPFYILQIKKNALDISWLAQAVELELDTDLNVGCGFCNSKENSDSSLTKKMVSVFIVQHPLKTVPKFWVRKGFIFFFFL